MLYSTSPLPSPPQNARWRVYGNCAKRLGGITILEIGGFLTSGVNQNRARSKMKNNNILWVDFIRVVASFFVVMLHSAAPLLYKYNNIPPLNWWAGNIYDSAVRICVPLFFIVSGYLLLGKEETIGEFFIKRANKILAPFIVWSILYVFWAHYFDNAGSLTFRSFYSLAISPAYYHLWFFYAIIGLYLYIPVLRIFTQHSSVQILYYFVALWFLAVSIVPIIEASSQVTSAVDLNTISGYVGYLVIGHLLGNAQINKRQFMQILLVAIICLIITAGGTFYLTIRNNGELNGYLYGYLSPNVIVSSVAAFLLLKYLSDHLVTSDRRKNVLMALSSASMGIYLIHPMVLYTVNAGWLGFPLSGFSASAVYSVPLTAVLTFGLSFVLVAILKKAPFLRLCLP